MAYFPYEGERLGRKPKQFEVAPESGGHREVNEQGPTGAAAGRENVYDGESRLRKTDPTPTHRVGHTSDTADVVEENERLKS